VRTLDALLLCDAAARDAQSGKWTLSGVFDAVWAPEFPAVHQVMDVYFRLRVTGTPAMRLLYRAPGGTTQLLATIGVQASGRGLVEGAVRVTGLPLAVPGDYRFELEVDGQAIGATGLTVAALPPRSTPLH
jgi:hypothetical protein